MSSDIKQSVQYLLMGRVIFNPLSRTLSSIDGVRILSISENESCLLKILLDDTCSKQKVLMEVWEKRGIIVTESSYYKLVRQLRNSLRNAGLDPKVIKTLHGVGISFTGAWTVIPQPTTDDINNIINYGHNNAITHWSMYRNIALCTTLASVIISFAFILTK